MRGKQSKALKVPPLDRDAFAKALENHYISVESQPDPERKPKLNFQAPISFATCERVTMSVITIIAGLCLDSGFRKSNICEIVLGSLGLFYGFSFFWLQRPSTKINNAKKDPVEHTKCPDNLLPV